MNYKHLLVATLSILSFVACQDKHEAQYVENLHQEVNPLIGTDFVGNTYPGATAPFGMVQLSPDNGLPGWDRISGYYYPDSTIAGFSHTHLSGTGAGDLYDISFLPVIEPALVAPEPLGVHAKFRHQNEEASAGHYKVLLEPYNIEVSLTATEHIGVQEYRFKTASDSAVIYLNLAKAMNWDKTLATKLQFDKDGKELHGYRHSTGWARNQEVYFFSRLSKEPKQISLDSVALKNDKGELQGWGYIAKLHYSVEQDERIVIETALSGVSEAAAERNYYKEKHTSFDRYLSETRQKWDEALGHIRIPKDTPSDISKVFYTALYHSLICPTIYSDVDGKYLGADRKIHQTEGKHYSTFSLWDTYRTAHPLYNIIMPSESRDMVQSLVDFGVQNRGHLPVWNMWASETDMMIGHHSIPVIAAALEAGIYQPKNPEDLLSALRSTLNRKEYRAMEEYRHYGYVPSDVHEESLSLTLEYAYNDWAAARIFRALGHEEEAKTYEAHALNYRNLWDKQTGYFRPRLKNGSFLSPFDPFAYTKHVTESNAYQYLWSVQHDVAGLIDLMGGKEKFAKRLDKFFSAETPKHIELPIFSTGMIGQYAHGNEPGHHTAFLYYYADMPWRSTDLIYDILTKLYTNTPDGLCGNEDCGQMSAWYVMSAMGLYPVEAANTFLITSPLLREVKIQLSEGNTFVIKAKDLSSSKRYIKSVKLNGKNYERMSLHLEDIRAGGTLELEMTDKQGLLWYKQ